MYAHLLKALADDSRLRIVRFLSDGEACVCEIAEKLDMSVALVSHHVSRLEESGVVASRKVGRWRHCRLDSATLQALADELAQTARSARNAADRATDAACVTACGTSGKAAS